MNRAHSRAIRPRRSGSTQRGRQGTRTRRQGEDPAPSAPMPRLGPLSPFSARGFGRGEPPGGGGVGDGGQGSRMSVVGDDLEHISVVPGGFLATNINDQRAGSSLN